MTPALDFPAIFFAIQRATLDARARLDDDTIGTRVKQGRYQVGRVVYPMVNGKPRGYGDFRPLTDWLSEAQVVDALDGLWIRDDGSLATIGG